MGRSSAAHTWNDRKLTWEKGNEGLKTCKEEGGGGCELEGEHLSHLRRWLGEGVSAGNQSTVSFLGGDKGKTAGGGLSSFRPNASDFLSAVSEWAWGRWGELHIFFFGRGMRSFSDMERRKDRDPCRGFVAYVLNRGG